MMSPAARYCFLPRLPRRVAPFPSEHLSSYLHRLGEANGLPGHELGNHVTNTGIAGRQAVHDLTGLPERTLVFALPELRTADDITNYPELRGSPAAVGAANSCPCCARRHGLTRAVHVWATHEQVLCQRHRVWTGGPILTCTDRSPRIDITALPDILRAHRHHHRLIARFGREPVRRAFEDASSIVHEWHNLLPWPFRPVHARLEVLEPNPNRWYLTAAICRAAEYPIVVALTTSLTDTAWRNRVLTMESPGQQDAIGGLIESVTDGAVPAGVFDSLLTRYIRHRPGARTRPAETVG